VYGAFASVPIFLLWIYFSWLTILSGALITASLSRWQHEGVQQLNAASQFYFSVRILSEMQAGLKTGTVQSLWLLSDKLHLAFEATESILEKLQQANMVRKLSGTGWTMIRDPEHISLRELSDLFLLDTSTLPCQAGDKKIHAWFGLVKQRLEEPQRLTLKVLIGG
jgi:membrane protein